MNHRILNLLLTAAGLSLSLAALAQGKPHQHGHLTLDVAVDATSVMLLLSTPLDNLVGFERAPRTEAERQRVAAALARLRAADLFVVDPAAQCRRSKVEITSRVLGLGGADPRAGKDGHADLAASFEFACRDAARAAFVEVGLFDAFAGVKRIDAQVATVRGQAKRTLRRPARRIELAR